MADQTDFKHITVNPAEPDDIVIHAGAPESGTGSSASNALANAPAKAKAEPMPGNSASAVQPSDYQPTTLDDIQSFKMSSTQIAVIVIALAAIVAFAVWYMVFS